MKQSGNTILITGGGSGIGEALAHRLHDAGNTVIVAGRRRGALDAATVGRANMHAMTLDIDSAEAIETFAADLIAAGCDLVDFAPFPDHAAYREQDLAFLADRSALLNAGLVTTEKDWFRLTPEWRTRVLSWPVKATFEDEGAFQALLLKAVGPHSAR